MPTIKTRNTESQVSEYETESNSAADTTGPERRPAVRKSMQIALTLASSFGSTLPPRIAMPAIQRRELAIVWMRQPMMRPAT
jgi:hypothetical protein